MKRIKLIEDFGELFAGDELYFNEKDKVWEFKSRSDDVGDGYESTHTSHVSLSDAIVQQNIHLFEPVGCYDCEENIGDGMVLTDPKERAENKEYMDEGWTDEEYFDDIMNKYSQLSMTWKKRVRHALSTVIVDTSDTGESTGDRAPTFEDYYNNVINTYAKLDEGWQKLVRTMLNVPYVEAEDRNSVELKELIDVFAQAAAQECTCKDGRECRSCKAAIVLEGVGEALRYDYPWFYNDEELNYDDSRENTDQEKEA